MGVQTLDATGPSRMSTTGGRKLVPTIHVAVRGRLHPVAERFIGRKSLCENVHEPVGFEMTGTLHQQRTREPEERREG
jgi:hypothetical protein